MLKYFFIWLLASSNTVIAFYGMGRFKLYKSGITGKPIDPQMEGMDGRFPTVPEDKDLEAEIAFRRWLYQLEMLKTLESPRVAETEKLKRVQEYEYYQEHTKYIANLLGGGLDNPFV